MQHLKTQVTHYCVKEWMINLMVSTQTSYYVLMLILMTKLLLLIDYPTKCSHWKEIKCFEGTCSVSD